MPTENEFRAALDKTLSFARDLDDQIDAEHADELAIYETNAGDELICSGHRFVTDDDSIYLVTGHPKFRFVSVVYFLDIRRYVFKSVDESLAAKVLEVEDEGITEQHRRDATVQLLNSMSSDDQEALEVYLYLMVSGDENSINFQKIDEEDGQDGLSHVVIGEKIFPYEEGFNIRKFYQAKRSVLNAGKRASELVPRSLKIEEPEDESERVSLRPRFQW